MWGGGVLERGSVWGGCEGCGEGEGCGEEVKMVWRGTGLRRRGGEGKGEVVAEQS